ncbi:bifunctional phosphopantothenoylcysteine decarboxylase/phosphopantothenate synthase, partial [Pseudomonas syringae pv. actinidiae ICMP 18807]
MAVAYSLDQKGRSMQRLYRKRIVLGVGGGIAAYKSAELVRRLRDQG